MSVISNNAAKFLWNNLRMYLMQYPTCLLDNLLIIKDPTAELPINRYQDFLNELGKHVGFAPYVNGQATQFSRIPYMTVNIAAIPQGSCTTRVVLGFDVVYATDTPDAPNGNTNRYVGNSNEAVASFQANIANALDELMFYAYDDASMPNKSFYKQSFFERLYKQTLPNPINPSRTKPWKYNIKGQVDDDNSISSTTQLKREDRSSGVSVFHVVYHLDINGLEGDGIDCDC